MARNTATAKIKHETRGEVKVKEKKMDSCDTPDCNTDKRLLCDNKQGKEDGTGGKIIPICQ